jgi:hypothetical protein
MESYNTYFFLCLAYFTCFSRLFQQITFYLYSSVYEHFVIFFSLLWVIYIILYVNIFSFPLEKIHKGGMFGTYVVIWKRFYFSLSQVFILLLWLFVDCYPFQTNVELVEWKSLFPDLGVKVVFQLFFSFIIFYNA